MNTSYVTYHEHIATLVALEDALEQRAADIAAGGYFTDDTDSGGPACSRCVEEGDDAGYRGEGRRRGLER
jgi:hypothetical protein